MTDQLKRVRDEIEGLKQEADAVERIGAGAVLRPAWNLAIDNALAIVDRITAEPAENKYYPYGVKHGPMPLRDPHADALFAAWVGVTPDKIPLEMKAFTCAATMKAWGRVAKASEEYLSTCAAPTDAAPLEDSVWIAGHAGEYGCYYPEGVEAEGEHGGTAVEFRRVSALTTTTIR